MSTLFIWIVAQRQSTSFCETFIKNQDNILTVVFLLSIMRLSKEKLIKKSSLGFVPHIRHDS